MGVVLNPIQDELFTAAKVGEKKICGRMPRDPCCPLVLNKPELVGRDQGGGGEWCGHGGGTALIPPQEGCCANSSSAKQQDTTAAMQCGRTPHTTHHTCVGLCVTARPRRVKGHSSTGPPSACRMLLSSGGALRQLLQAIAVPHMMESAALCTHQNEGSMLRSLRPSTLSSTAAQQPRLEGATARESDPSKLRKV